MKKNIMLSIILFFCAAPAATITAMENEKKQIDYSRTQFIQAAKNNNTQAIEKLIAAGADINQGNSLGWTPLIWVILRNEPECIPLLVNTGADIHKADSDDYTPLHWAAEKGNLESVKQLIAHGACVHARSSFSGETALMKAAKKGFTDIVQLLMKQYGVDPHLKNAFSKTALFLAAIQGVDNLSMCELLVEEMLSWETTKECVFTFLNCLRLNENETIKSTYTECIIDSLKPALLRLLHNREKTSEEIKKINDKYTKEHLLKKYINQNK